MKSIGLQTMVNCCECRLPETRNSPFLKPYQSHSVVGAVLAKGRRNVAVQWRRVARRGLAAATIVVVSIVGLYATGLLGIAAVVVRMVPVIGPLTEPLFRQRVDTVAGPESEDLQRDLLGCIVYDVNDQPGKRISLRVVSLPNGETRLETWPIHDGWVHALAGPDRDGRLAIIEDRLFSQPPTHRLRVLSLRDDSVVTLFDRPGSALWDDKIGEHIALSATDGLIAVVTTLRRAQMRSPDALLREGQLEIWDLGSRKVVHTLDDVLDDSMSWFPGGKRLTFAKLTRRRTLTPGQNDDFGMWERAPVVYMWDFATEPVVVGLGWHPVVSADGETILASGFEEHPHLLDANTGTVRDVEWPARYSTSSVLAVLKSEVLFHGLVTEGADRAWATTGSPLASRPQLRPIKVAEFNTRRFATLTEAFDPRHKVSFGRGNCAHTERAAKSTP